MKRIVLLGARCGVRVGKSEILKLRWENVDFSRGVLIVPAALKNAREPWREVPLQEGMLGLLRDWHEEDMKSGCEYIVHSPNGDGLKYFNASWARAKSKVGIKRKLPPYSLRHKFATDLIAEGADPGTVARLLGHATTAMVFSHYQHVLTKQKIRAIETLPTVHKAGNRIVCAQSHVHTKAEATDAVCKCL